MQQKTLQCQTKNNLKGDDVNRVAHFLGDLAGNEISLADLAPISSDPSQPKHTHILMVLNEQI